MAQGPNSNVRSLAGQPTLADFNAARGTPIVIDTTAGNERLFILNADGEIVELTTVTLKDTPQLDAFGRLRVSTAYTLFDSQQEYGLDTRTTWDITANGTLPAAGSSDGSVTSGSNAVGPRTLNTSMTPITTSTTNGHYSILQSRQYTRYIPGKSHLVLMTGIFCTGSGSTASFVMRTSTSGSAVDTAVPQASWNLDKLDGTGASGLTLDLTKTQILFIQAQWLGVGRVIVGFDIDGVLVAAHEFLNANNLTVPYTQTFNLPVRMEVRNTGAATTVTRSGYFDHANGVFLEASRGTIGGTAQFVCCSVQSEGGVEVRGFPNSAPPARVTVGVTTRRPILSIRPKATYNSKTNRAHIESIEATLRCKTNDAFYELVIGGTLTGAAWTSVGADSCVEYDSTATAITGGVAVLKGYVLSGAGTVASSAGVEADLRNPLVLSQIDALTATQIPFSIVATSVTGTSDLDPILNWHEQTI